jgi:hypothetical protein
MRNWRRRNRNKQNTYARNYLKSEAGKAHKRRKRESEKHSGLNAECQRRYYNDPSIKPTQARQRWGVVEDAAIVQKVMPDKALAQMVGRTVRAVQARRCLLRKSGFES